MRTGLDYLNKLPEWNGQGGFTTAAIASVLSALGNPQNRPRSVHVAGTNGKGSVCAMVSSILGSAGYKVGLTISPHLQSLNERVVIDGSPISDDTLDYYANQIRSVVLSTGVELSFFEALTASAFLCFAELHVDFSIIETGLGGRLDATNTLSRPEVCSIVTIDLDHQDILGSTLEQIAREKAGIIKHSVPLVTGRMAKAPLVEIDSVRRQARGGEHYRYGIEYDVIEALPVPRFRCVDFADAHLRPLLQGEHQIHNAAVAAMTASILGVNAQHVSAGIEGAFWPGRLEEVRGWGRDVIMDCGHNPAGLSQVISFLDTKGIGKVDVAFGALATKDWRQMLTMLRPCAHQFLLLEPLSTRAVPAEEIADYLSSNGIRNRVFAKDYDRFKSGNGERSE